MEPDTNMPKTMEDRRRSLANSSEAKAVDALQVQLFAKALVGLGLTQYSPLVPDRRRRT